MVELNPFVVPLGRASGASSELHENLAKSINEALTDLDTRVLHRENNSLVIERTGAERMQLTGLRRNRTFSVEDHGSKYTYYVDGEKIPAEKSDALTRFLDYFNKLANISETETSSEHKHEAFTREGILVLDFGSQFTQVIAKKLNKEGVYAHVRPFFEDFEHIQRGVEDGHIKGVIFSGGPNSIYQSGAPACDPRIFNSGVPILGICYGMQMMADQLGALVSAGQKREYGNATLEANGHQSQLLADYFPESNQQIVWMSHGDKVTSLPEGFSIIAQSDNAEIAAFENSSKGLYGLQFHPEVEDTQDGDKIIKSFIDITGAKGDWTLDKYIDEQIEKVKAKVGDEKVLLALSGGVDSSTLAMLLHKAIGQQLECVYVDNGLMRKDETEELEKVFNEYGVNYHIVHAGEDFLGKLNGVTDPQKKREIIGETFIRVFEREAERLGQENPIKYLAQGTIQSDVIESAGVRIDPMTGDLIAASIKKHHNVGALPDEMHFDQEDLIEPQRELFKDQVREVATKLGLEDFIVSRKPFPGPGLAVRIVDQDITKEKVTLVQEADYIARKKLEEYPPSDKAVSQLVVALPPSREVLDTRETSVDIAAVQNIVNEAGEQGIKVEAFPMKSTGVKGDDQNYDEAVVLKAQSSAFSEEFLRDLSTRITNEVAGVNRVLLDISDRDTVAYEQAIMIRPVTTVDFMTAKWTALSNFMRQTIAGKILEEVNGIDRVLFDITNKPPATVEYE